MNSTTWDILRKMYERSERNFDTDLAYYQEHGYVFDGGHYLLMGRAVGDYGWFIHLAIGKNGLQEFVNHMPYYLPHIGFSRDPSGVGEVKWYSTEKLVRKICKSN